MQKTRTNREKTVGGQKYVFYLRMDKSRKRETAIEEECGKNRPGEIKGIKGISWSYVIEILVGMLCCQSSTSYCILSSMRVGFLFCMWWHVESSACELQYGLFIYRQWKNPFMSVHLCMQPQKAVFDHRQWEDVS